MKIEQFKKAAKRYSASANLPLNQAQEQMATFFGFKNFDAARKSLEPKSETSLPQPAHEWISSATAEAIVQRFKDLSPAPENEDSARWFERGFNLLDAVVRALCFLREAKVKDLTMEVLVEYLSVEKVEELYLIGDKEFKSSGTWPEAFLRVKSYLEDGGLPGYKTAELLKGNGILDENEPRIWGDKFKQYRGSYEQHAWRTFQLVPALTAMGAFGNEEKKQRFLGYAQTAQTNPAFTQAVERMNALLEAGPKPESPAESSSQHKAVSSLSTLPSKSNPGAGIFWRGLSHKAFKLLCFSLKEKHMRDIRSKGAETTWELKGFDLALNTFAVIPLVDQTTQTSEALREYLRLENIERLHLEVANQPDQSSFAVRKFLEYLEYLPGYRLTDLNSVAYGHKSTVRAEALEQHQHRRAFANELIMDELDYIGGSGLLQDKKFCISSGATLADELERHVTLKMNPVTMISSFYTNYTGRPDFYDLYA